MEAPVAPGAVVKGLSAFPSQSPNIPGLYNSAVATSGLSDPLGGCAGSPAIPLLLPRERDMQITDSSSLLK